MKAQVLCVCSLETSLKDHWHAPFICIFMISSSISLPELQSDSGYLWPWVGGTYNSDDTVVVAGIPKSVLNNTVLTALACMTQTFVLARKKIYFHYLLINNVITVSLKIQYLSFFYIQFLIILQPASLPEVLPTILLNYVPLVVFLLPILWTVTFSHFVGISRKSFSIYYQQRQILIQFFHLGYILTTNFCWLCLAVKFKHGSGVTLIKLLMKQNMAQVACARLLVVGLFKTKHSSTNSVIFPVG